MSVRTTPTPGQALPAPWQGALIVADWGESPPPDDRPVRFRRSFDLDGPPIAAALYVTACGVFEAEVNGEPVGDHVLAPGWTSYHDRHRVERHDVTSLLVEGANVLGLTVAEGWYRGRLGYGGGRRAIYGDALGPMVHLELHLHDGSSVVVASDRSWRAGLGPILASSLYDGEAADLRQADAGWSSPGCDDRGWSPVTEVPFDVERLFRTTSPPVRRRDVLAPVGIERSPSGQTIVDFGQNLAGRVRLRLPADPGRTITLRHAEVLDHGELALEPLRTAVATDHVTCSAVAGEWEPSFTLHGFRYAEVSGWDGELRPEHVRAVACHTDLPEIGTFACSDPLLDRLHENVRWSTKSNFVDVPTDCPQRDERLGYTGDLQVFVATACRLVDCESMLDSWLHDLAADQARYGTVAAVVPWLEQGVPPRAIAGWGDAAVIVPWTLYEQFGDPDLLRRHLPAMRAWVDQVAGLAGPSHLWDTGLQLGDWLDPSAPDDQPWRARADARLVASAYHARTADLVARACAVVGAAADHQRYADLAASVRAAFVAEYVTASGRMVSDAPTAYAMALAFDLLPTVAQRARAGRRLQELVHADGHRIGTGFLGTPLVCDALADAGFPDDAYHLLLQTECPSWLYPVTRGATTTWERWDAIRPDGTLNTPEMTSFNHYALGAVADFLHRRVAGLEPLAPGYRSFAVRPLPGGGLTWAEVTRAVPTGRCRVRWERHGAELAVEVDVPEGTTALVSLPDGSRDRELGPGAHLLRCVVRPASEDPARPDPPDRLGRPPEPG